MGKTCPGQKSRSSTWATLVEPTFPSFPHKTWRAIYMKNKTMAPLKAGYLASLVTWLAWSPLFDNREVKSHVYGKLETSADSS